MRAVVDAFWQAIVVLIAAGMLVIGFICSGVSFPLMFWERKSLWPNSGSAAVEDACERVFTWGGLGKLNHDLKNLITELVRSDAQWWSKFGCFLFLCYLIREFQPWRIFL